MQRPIGHISFPRIVKVALPLTKILLMICAFGIVNGCSKAPNTDTGATEKKPNILLIVADDLGYSDLGAYGGEIDTPNLDSLAARGTKLTNFHVAPTCSLTRAMLMSGTYNQLAGLGAMAEWLADNQKNEPGYEGYLNSRVVSLPARLQESGYATLMAGKWHLGMEPGQGPDNQGFDDSFVMLPGAGNHYSDRGLMPFLPIVPYRENGQEVSLPESFYSTDFYTDKTIEYIDKARKTPDKPFFAYVAYTSPHWPLQVDKKYSDKYIGKYDAGYEKIREARLQKIAQIELFEDEVTEVNSSRCYPSWNQLSKEEQIRQARMMEVYAGMVDSLDENIGRLVKHLKDIGEYDNTIIMFISDNGADARPEHGLSSESEYMKTNYNNDYDNVGAENSFVSYGGAWAQVGSTPFNLHKGMTTEGGILSPAIIHYPKGNLQGGTRHEFASIMDLLPTFLELAETTESATKLATETTLSITGKSLMSYLRGEADSVHQDQVYGFSIFRRQGLQYNNWKVVKTPAPYGNEEWQLFDLENDLGETNDLAQSQPDVLLDMVGKWDKFAKDTGIVIASADSRFPGECAVH